MEQSKLFGQAVRVAFHDGGEGTVLNNEDMMGSDGCLSDTDENNGIKGDNSLVTTVMDPIWQQYCDQISNADFWALFAKLVLDYSSGNNAVLVNPFYYGRVDTTNCSSGAGRLPSAQRGQDGYQSFFVEQLGFTLEEGITLLGAHSLGHVNPANSGYGLDVSGNTNNNPEYNAWDRTPATFDNAYYDSLSRVPWTNSQQPNDNNQRSKNIWLDAGNQNNKRVMLNSDMAAGFDFDERTEPSSCQSCGVLGQRCGGRNSVDRCQNPSSGTSVPSTAAQVARYIAPNDEFLRDFGPAFFKMVSVGYEIAPASGKLGTLNPIDLDTCLAAAPSFNPTSLPVPSMSPTAMPTTSIPTLSPTVMPTVSYTGFTFTSVLPISGYVNCNAISENEKSYLAQSVAVSMNVDNSQVIYSDCNSDNATSRRCDFGDWLCYRIDGGRKFSQ